MKIKELLLDWSNNIDAIDLKIDMSVLEERSSFKISLSSSSN